MRVNKVASIAVVLTAIGAAVVGLMLVLFMASLPQKEPYRPLLNGYSVFAANSTDISIVQDGPEGGGVVVGGIITEVAVAPEKGIIVGINHPQYTEPTYFVVDTNEHRADTGLSVERCRMLLRERYGMEVPKLQDVGDLFRPK